MSWFRRDRTPSRTPEPQANPYSRPIDDEIPDEYESNRNALLAPQGGPRRGPSPSQRPQRNRYDEPDEDEEEVRRANLLRKGPPPPSAQAAAREANSVRAMPDRTNRNGGPNDAYSRGARDLDQDRADLFSGATVQRGPGNRTQNAGGGQVQEDEEEDDEAIQTKTKDLKQQTVQSTREALRMMREAEETGKNTLLKLGSQSEQLGMTERHLQNSKGFVRRADDNANDIKVLNRSIFIPAITFDKSKKRAEQDAKLNRRYEEEQSAREDNQRRMRDTHDRIADATRDSDRRYNRDGPPDEDDEEGLGGGPRYNAQQMAARKAQWKRFQTKDDDEEDDAMEDEIANGLDEMSAGIARIKALAKAQGDEVQRQNKQLRNLHRDVEDVDQRLATTTEKMRRL